MSMTEELDDKLQVSHDISEGQDDAEHHHRPHHLHLLPSGEGRGVALNFHVQKYVQKHASKWNDKEWNCLM